MKLSTPEKLINDSEEFCSQHFIWQVLWRDAGHLYALPHVYILCLFMCNR